MPSLTQYTRSEFEERLAGLIETAPGICYTAQPLTRIMGGGEHGLRPVQVDTHLKAGWLVACRFGYQGMACLIVDADGQTFLPLFGTTDPPPGVEPHEKEKPQA